jgi:uncharacterized delta-60 repeat protein
MVSVLFCLATIFSSIKRSGAAGADLDTSFGKSISGGDFQSDKGDTDNVAGLLASPGTIAFSSSSYSVSETAGNATITVKRTGGTDNKVVGEVTLMDVTTTPEDYRFKPGERDPSFNVGGTGANGILRATAVQEDGKILIAGDLNAYNGAAANGGITRLNTDGTLDTTFNPGGTGANNRVYAIALQEDGKIIIGGTFTGYNGVNANDYIARLNTDGTLDTSFNMGQGGANNFVYAVAVQADGKILIGGDFTAYNGISIASDRILRLNTDGSLDTSFNHNGAGPSGTVYAIAVQEDGKILIAGNFITYNGVNASDRVARLNTDGSLDTTFNMGGTGANSTVMALALQADGKILIGGSFITYDGLNASDKIACLNTDGTLDTSFNMGGTGANANVYAIAVQPNGKIIIGGDFNVYNGDLSASDKVARLQTDGSLDTLFNMGGKGASNTVLGIAVQPNGKIVVVGKFYIYNGVRASDFIVRLDGDLFVTWPAGDASNKIIRLPIVNDGLNEPNETLNLSLTVLSGGATLGSPNTATLTILDANDAPVNTVPAAQSTNENTALVFSSANGNQISVADADAGTNAVRVTLTATHGTLTLHGTNGLSFTTGDGTNDVKMSFTGTISAINTALNGLSFTPTQGFSGAASLQVVTNDLGRTGTGGPQSDADTIDITVNEGGTLQLSAATFSVNEGAATATVTVTRTLGSHGAASVHYATSNGTAIGASTCTAGKDYQTRTGTLSWADGDAANKTFTVPICNDTVYEGNETINLTLSNVTGSASLGTPSSAVLTIVDDETQPKLSVSNVTVTEGDTGTRNANFMVKLSGASSKTVTVKYATLNGTATAPADYTAVPLTTLTFTPGQTSKTVTVVVKGDMVLEGNETFFVNLSAPVNATIADAQGQGTITNDD